MAVAERDTMAEMQAIVRAAGYPHEPGGSVKAAIRRAAIRLGLTYRRARTFWGGDERASVRAEEADRLRAWYLDFVATKAERLERELTELRARERALGDHIYAARLALPCGTLPGAGGRPAIGRALVCREGV